MFLTNQPYKTLRSFPELFFSFHRGLAWRRGRSKIPHGTQPRCGIIKTQRTMPLMVWWSSWVKLKGSGLLRGGGGERGSKPGEKSCHGAGELEGLNTALQRLSWRGGDWKGIEIRDQLVHGDGVDDQISQCEIRMVRWRLGGGQNGTMEPPNGELGEDRKSQKASKMAPVEEGYLDRADI
ncbi:uncharacterized protein BDZ99DRAFT_253748 [Mytilinidion resinicola]|uniref:Uncharacterized protein n=1 Tax=Mytilinidion resinicola TaxID=574789 RepID=A0A6A6YWY3_9PEZI|nr:uncharacterized protein BDZ99DRAFT_253748 [Mytilinidion resinicola]KAF2813321.1 hypothetical protein BDZ99DRAFT_253748 [Mytilinidion resinicola]